MLCATRNQGDEHLVVLDKMLEVRKANDETNDGLVKFLCFLISSYAHPGFGILLLLT